MRFHEFSGLAEGCQDGLRGLSCPSEALGGQFMKTRPRQSTARRPFAKSGACLHELSGLALNLQFDLDPLSLAQDHDPDPLSHLSRQAPPRVEVVHRAQPD